MGISFPNVRSFIMYESYYQKTVLSDFVLSFLAEDAYEVAGMGNQLRDCSSAKRSIASHNIGLTPEGLSTGIEHLPSSERKKFEDAIFDACKVYILGTSDGRARAFKVEPEYRELELRYRALRKEAQMAPAKQQVPAATSELTEVTKRLEEIAASLVQASANRITTTNAVAHIVAILLFGIGIVYRRNVGSAVLFPFGWIFSAAKKVHEKI